MSNIQIIFPDQSVKSFNQGVTGRDVALSIAEGLARRALAVKVNDQILGLSEPITTDCTLKIITPDNSDPDCLYVLRHSCAHVLAEAVCDVLPGTKLAYGPPVDDGFYYDLASPRPISEDDFPAIEKRMNEIIAENRPFVRCEYNAETGLQRTAGDKYKTDNAERALQKGDSILSFYSTGQPGESFEDLCAGPHVPATGVLKAYKIMSVAGAYWHGDQESDQLTRIYGTCFADSKGLNAYLTMLEEAKKRDHRRVGKELDLFHLEEHSPGMVFWHPRGAAIYNTLKDYVRETIGRKGYQEVITPEVVEKTLWEKSGHWDKYQDLMFVTKSENREFAVKPMNCPCHIEIFKQGLKSWRDLPLRMAEFGKCHRNELAGTMHGLMRVRGFVQDDAHIFCTEEQIASEVADFCELIKKMYADFGFHNVLVKFATRPVERVGDDSIWDLAEKALEEATAKAGLQYQLNPGEGAFYGPKLEFVLKDSLGRDWQCGTIQVDLNMPGRLGATYIGQDGQKHVPVMLHRAALGSIERFLAILTEEYAGDFPVWLAPIQARVVPVSEKFAEYALTVKNLLVEAGIRTEIDERDEKLGYKIREGEKSKIPYLVVCGEKEALSGLGSLRKRKSGDLGQFSIGEIIEKIKSDILQKVLPD
jgi:threonyl-tRNA synthetase